MYVILVDENKTSQEKLQAQQIRSAVLSVAPDIRCEIVSASEGGDAAIVKPAPLLRVQCFGEFEVFSREQPLYFKRARSKELMAILVCNRGSMLSMGRLMSILWEDGNDTDSDRSYLRSLISDLKRTLTDAGAGDVIIKRYNSIGIDASRINCDYYDFLEGKVDAVERYNGQFMTQYPWAEYELSRI